jgi:hypothetical protein
MFDTDVSVAFTRGGFRGHARSASSSCVAGRHVRLMRVRRGREKLVAGTSTGDRGQFRFPDRSVSGKFFVRVTRSEMTVDGTSLTCNASSSPKIVVKS